MQSVARVKTSIARVIKLGTHGGLKLPRVIMILEPKGGRSQGHKMYVTRRQLQWTSICSL